MPIRVDVDQVADALGRIVAEVDRTSAQIVRIDGHSGVGKTTLAKLLASRLATEIVSVDKYIPDELPRTGSRLDNLDAEGFRERVRAVQRKHGRVVVEGVRLCEFLPGDEYPGLAVYLEREDVSRDEAQRRKKLGTDVYHQRYDPAVCADVLVSVRS